MLKYKKRILMEFEFLSNQSGYVTAKEMSERFKVSDKTIKNDIQELSDLCSDNGSELVSKKHYGYKIEVSNQSQFDSFKNIIYIYFNSSGVNSANVTDERLVALLQTILSSDEYLNTDELSSIFYVTRSSILKKMKQIYEILDSYNLKIRNYNENGPMIVGNEYDIRILMLDTIENFHYLNTIFMFRRLYDKFFDLNDEERLGLRQIFLDTLRKNRYRLRDDSVNKIAMYLCLLKKRYENGYTLNFSKEETDTIHSFKMYPIIKKMFDDFAAFTDYPTDDNEIIGLCLYLMCHIDGDIGETLFPQRYIIRAQRFANIVLEKIEELYGISFDDEKDFARLVSALSPMMLQLDFGLSGHKYAYQLSSEYCLNPLSTDLARVFSIVFEQEFKSSLSITNQVLLGLLLSDLVINVSYPFKRLNIALVSLYNLNNAEVLLKIFISRFGRYINMIDTYELYELRPYSRDSFDVVVINFGIDENRYGYRYGWPVFSFENMPTDQNLNDFYNKFIINQLGVDKLIKKYNIPVIDYFRNTCFDSIASFTEMLILKHGKGNQGIAQLRTFLSSMRYNFNHVAFYFLPSGYVNREFIEIYRFSGAIASKNDIKYGIAISVNYNEELLKVRIIHDFLALSLINYDKFKKFIESEDRNLIELCVKESLKVFPITVN